MLAAGHLHHHHGHGGQYHHSRRWGSGNLSVQQEQQAQQQPNSSYSMISSSYAATHLHNSSNGGNSSSSSNGHGLGGMQQVATATTTTTTTQQQHHQLLPAPSPTSHPTHSRLIGLPSPAPSSALNVYTPPSSAHHHHQYLGHHAGFSVKKHHGRSHISDDEKEEIRMAFELFDSNKTGKLSYRELKVAMRALDFDVHKLEVKRLMEEHTKDGNTNEVDIDEFMDILIFKYKERDPDEELSKAFKYFDEDGTGKITLKNLRKVARDLGEHIPDEELDAMIEEFDNDQDGAIDEAEFYNIMKGDDFDD